jgi:hypothetical protein
MCDPPYDVYVDADAFALGVNTAVTTGAATAGGKKPILPTTPPVPVPGAGPDGSG